MEYGEPGTSEATFQSVHLQTELGPTTSQKLVHQSLISGCKGGCNDSQHVVLTSGSTQKKTIATSYMSERSRVPTIKWSQVVNDGKISKHDEGWLWKSIGKS